MNDGETRLKQECEELRATVGVLSGALRPFAECASDDPRFDDSEYDGGTEFTYGDLRAADEALASLPAAAKAHMEEVERLKNRLKIAEDLYREVGNDILPAIEICRAQSIGKGGERLSSLLMPLINKLLTTIKSLESHIHHHWSQPS